ncbi:MAG: hypothetical protein IT478_06025 [Xanthomonadales bacterium]|nr:hypothetical protein [Xanthomonadales bacterium]
MRLAQFTRPLAFAIVSALAASTAQAALIVDEQFEGTYYNTTQSGRGVNFDWFQTSSTGGIMGIVFYTYDAAGNPSWVLANVPFGERESKKTNIDVFRFTGGSFGNTFTAPTSANVGKLDVEFLSCNRVKLDFVAGAGSNLQNFNMDLERFFGAPASCAYQTEFSACPAGTSRIEALPRTCQLPATITGNLHLPNNATYLINGKTSVGGGRNTQPGTLTIEPGTLIQGLGQQIDYLVVQPGSKLYAEGTSTAPILFTGPTDSPGSWAGLVLAGNAVNNSCTGATPCAFEADSNITFGGSDDNDSSGSLRFVQIRYAGQVIRENEELNALTLLAVGRGTVIDHVHVHGGKDDGFEMFGGSVNAKYLVGTAIEDDCLDFAEGYTGKIQYAYCKQTATASGDSNGVESDNKPNAFDLLPRTQPRVANVTLIGVGSGNEGVRIRRGSGGNYYNLVATGFGQECLNFNDSATFTASGSAATPTSTGMLTMSGSALGCATNFEDSGSDPFLVSAWYRGQSSNSDGAAAALGLSGRFPAASSILLGSGVGVPGDSFFDTVNFKGAFSGVMTDWARGWTMDGTLD